MQIDEKKHEWRSNDEWETLPKDLEHNAKQSLPIIRRGGMLYISKMRMWNIRTTERDGRSRHTDDVHNEDGQYGSKGDDKQERTWRSKHMQTCEL